MADGADMVTGDEDASTGRPSEPRRVVILIERETGYRQSVLRGIFRYSQQVANWICQGSNLDAESVDMVARMRPQPHGVIAGLWHLPLAKRLAKLRLPIVDVFDWHLQTGLPRVNLDNYAIGVIAAEHLLSRGFRQFAFFGHVALHFSAERRRGFEETLRKQGIVVRVAPAECSDTGAWVRNQPSVRRPLEAWIRSLPKPIAVFCASDGWGMELTDICHSLRVGVPDEMAVLGVDNDELLCSLSRPALSSIDTGAERVGYQASAILQRLMDGQTDVPRQVLIAPGQVVERVSTNVLLVDDADVAMALRFIRDNAHRALHINDVVNHVVVPRRTLQRRFRQLVGHSLTEEVARCRLERAKRLLAETDIPVPQVARRCGYGNRERLWASFRRRTDVSPIDYRRRFRSEPPGG